MWMWIVAIVCLLASLGFLGKYFYEKKKQQEQKGFLVLLGAVALVWFFPGVALFIIAVALLLMLLH